MEEEIALAAVWVVVDSAVVASLPLQGEEMAVVGLSHDRLFFFLGAVLLIPFHLLLIFILILLCSCIGFLNLLLSVDACANGSRHDFKKGPPPGVSRGLRLGEEEQETGAGG